LIVAQWGGQCKRKSPTVPVRPQRKPPLVLVVGRRNVVEETGDDEDDGSLDESGLNKEEIATIVQQASTTRAKAVRALKKHGNIVDAILELTP